MNQAMGYFTGVLGSLWSKGQALISIFSLLIITPVVAFYLGCDWDRIVRSVDQFDTAAAARNRARPGARDRCDHIGLCPRPIRCLPDPRVLLRGRSDAGGLKLRLSHRGGLRAHQLHSLCRLADRACCLAVASRSRSSSRNGAESSSSSALCWSANSSKAMCSPPKLVGHSVGLHPVWLMFALFAFGYLFGFVGLLLAVPLAAAAGVLIRFALQRYRASPLYTGGRPS